MGYKKILVAVDRFQHSQVVFDHALDMAQKETAELMIFCCLKQYTPADLENRVGTAPTKLDDSEAIKIRRRLVDVEIIHAKSWVNTLAKQAEAKQITVETLVEEGMPGPNICELAKNWRADLLVVGRTRRSKFAERFLGSVSNYVIHDAPCSVLLVQ